MTIKQTSYTHPAKDDQTIGIGGQPIHLAKPTMLPDCDFIGRCLELGYCETAWGIDPLSYELIETSKPLHFRLQGPPGVGKNEIVYEIARRLGLPLYTFQGHEEVTPEDLAIHLVPERGAGSGGEIPLILRASTLATAIHTGGLFFFDEINRVPERSLSPLASVLDSRLYLDSAMTGLRIAPRDNQARKSFRFCCALNPGVGGWQANLPEYIEERTLPVIEVDYPTFGDLIQILERNIRCDRAFLDAFASLYQYRQISVRQAISLLQFAVRYEKQWTDPRDNSSATPDLALQTAACLVFGGGGSSEGHGI